MQYGKKSQQGFAERMAVIHRHFPEGATLVDQALSQWPRKMVARDDVVDALVAAITATMESCCRTLPEAPETDDFGLPMEMVYAHPQ